MNQDNQSPNCSLLGLISGHSEMMNGGLCSIHYPCHVVCHTPCHTPGHCYPYSLSSPAPCHVEDTPAWLFSSSVRERRWHSPLVVMFSSAWQPATDYWWCILVCIKAEYHCQCWHVIFIDDSRKLVLSQINIKCHFVSSIELMTTLSKEKVIHTNPFSLAYVIE